MKNVLLLTAATLMVASSASAQLMMADSTGDRIMLFDAFDGSLLDADWLTDQGAQGWEFSTPKEAAVIGNEIWVPDQIEDAVHRFDLGRNFLGSITTGAGGQTLDNLRSVGFDGSTVYVVNAGGSIGNAVVKYDAGGNEAGSFAIGGSSFDAERHFDTILVSNTSSDSIERYGLGGNLIDEFATGLAFAEQVVVLPDNTVLVANAIASAGQRGLYHYNADGTLITFIDVQSIGNPVTRGGALLGNGNYLLAAGSAVVTAEPDGQGGYIFTEVVNGVGAQYLTTFIPEPASGVLLVIGAVAALVRRRRR